jgi:leucyl aminopeptidase
MKFINILSATAFAVVVSTAALFSGQAIAQTTYLNTTTGFSDQPLSDADTLVVLVPSGQGNFNLDSWAQATTDQVARAIAAQDFTGAADEQLELLAPVDLPVDRLILVGVGEPSDLPRHQAETIGAALSVAVNGSKKAEAVEVNTRLITDDGQAARIAAQIAHGLDLRNYRFDRYKSEPAARPAQLYHWQVTATADARQQYTLLSALAQGVFTARELTNLPGADGYPAAFAEYAMQQLAPLGVEVTILTPDQVLEQGMGSLYGVSKGSQHKAHLLVAHWRGSDDQVIALVGKGNTFDTGGYNIKTDGSSMLQMIGDKSGGAAVVGAIQALAGQRAPVNVVAVVPLSQNAISGEAMLPGDVLTAGNGKTIEVGSTDAEGRLILADGIWYARHHFNPRVIADIATLTGAKNTALGTSYSAMFTNEADIRDSMTAAGELTDELVWPLPLNNYPGIISSRVADMRNTGTPGAQAGAIFLQQFAEDTPWVHIDMASEALSATARGINPEGATGHGVRLLAEWVKLFADQ